MFGEALIAALIAAAGSIIAAVITAVTSSGGIGKRSWNWPRWLGYSGALLVVGVACFYAFSDWTAARLKAALPEMAGYRSKVYSNVGIGFNYPAKWDLEDYAFRFGGGAMVLVKDRSHGGLYEPQGLDIFIENIAEHHWENIDSQFTHIRERMRKNCSNYFYDGMENIGNGYTAKVFKCGRLETEGSEKVTINECVYLYPLSKCVRVRILIWTWLNGDPRSEFEAEVRNFLKSIRIDKDKMNESEAFCIEHAKEKS